MIKFNIQYKMNKKYFAPAMQVEEAQAAQMLAESMTISDTTVDGSNALTKENEDWEFKFKKA